MSKLLPLELNDVPPNEGYERLVPRYKLNEGLPEGIHSGGPFISPDGKKVWKPTDIRPWPNSDFRVYSDEATALMELIGIPAFPLNWKLVEQNGRQWIVRPFSLVVQSDEISSGQAEIVHDSIVAMMDYGWFLNDPIVTAIDPLGQIFIVDLSNAGRVNKGYERQDRREQLNRFTKWLSVGWPEEAEEWWREDRKALQRIEDEIRGG